MSPARARAATSRLVATRELTTADTVPSRQSRSHEILPNTVEEDLGMSSGTVDDAEPNRSEGTLRLSVVAGVVC